MAIAPVEPAPGLRAPSAQFRVTIENDGDRDLIVNLGYMFGNGQVMLPTSLDLILTDPSGRARELRYFSQPERSPRMNPGKLDDYILALRSGSTYGFSLHLDEYWCPATKEFPLRLLKGQHRIQARLNAGVARMSKGDLALLRFWRDTVQSTRVSFGVSDGGAIYR